MYYIIRPDNQNKKKLQESLIGSVSDSIKLESSANSTTSSLLFTLGRSFRCILKSLGPMEEPCTILMLWLVTSFDRASSQTVNCLRSL